MAKISKEAIRILSERITKKIVENQSKKASVFNKEEKAIIALHERYYKEADALNKKINALVREREKVSNSSYEQLCKLNKMGVYKQTSREGRLITYTKTRSSYNLQKEIHDSLVLGCEFDKKSLETLEKELVEQFSK